MHNTKFHYLGRITSNAFTSIVYLLIIHRVAMYFKFLAIPIYCTTVL